LSQPTAEILQILTPVKIRINKVAGAIVASTANGIKERKIVRINPYVLEDQADRQKGYDGPKPDAQADW